MTRPDQERILLLETSLDTFREETRSRLREGAQTFAKLREDAQKEREDMRRMVQERAWVRWAQVIGVLVVVGSVAYAAGKYPDREEFDASVGRVHERLDGVEVDVAQLRLDQRDIKAATESTQKSVEALGKSIDRKLDAALSQPQRRRR